MARDAGFLAPWFGRAAPWIAGAVLVAGVIAFAVTRLDRGASAPPHRKAPLEAAEQRVALEGGRWLVSAWLPTSTVTPPSGK